jgi:hypothetical protein
MRITFLLPTIGFPRHVKRIRALRRLGASVNVLAFAREGHLRDEENPDLRVLGRIAQEEILERSLTLLRALPVIREAARQSDVLYAFGPDQLAVARTAIAGLARKPKLVSEIGDLHPFLVQRRPLAALGRAIERASLGGDVLLVVTSPGFLAHYYEPLMGSRPFRSLVIENKVDPEATPEPLPLDPAPTGPIRIGWFGSLRCERSWEVLRRVAVEGEGRVCVVLRGVPVEALDDLPERVADTPNMEFGGRYTVPRDLPAMYGGIDLCWMVHHDTVRPRECWIWARSNRLYEAGWFRTPLVGQVDKDDSAVLLDHNLGMTVDVTDPDASVRALLRVDRGHVAHWRDRIAQAPRSLFALTDEHEKLMALLRS